MKYAELLLESSRGMFVRTQPGNAITKFINERGDIITPLDNIVLPMDGQFFKNDTIDSLPYGTEKLPAKQKADILKKQKQIALLPVTQQKKLLKTGHQNLLLALEDIEKECKAKYNIKNNNWIVVSDENRLTDAAALIILFRNQRNETIAFIKLFKSKSLGTVPFLWSLGDFEKETGFHEANKSGTGKNNQQVRTKLNLKPTTVVGTEKSMTPEQIVKQVETTVNNNTELPENVKTQVVELINNVNSGFNTLVPGAGEFASAYEVDLGETVAPMAIVTGHFVSGSYQEAENQLLKAIDPSWSWKKVKNIRYPLAGNEALYDSYLNFPKGFSIAVSSKDKSGGAAASISGIVDSINKFPERYEDVKSDPKYKTILRDLYILDEMNSTEGPLTLAIKYKIITAQEKIEVLAAMDDPHKTEKQLSPRLKAIVRNPIYNPIKTNQYTVGYHLMSTIARLVTAKLNENVNLVTAFFKQVLSKSNMIQVKTKVTVGGKDKKDATFTNFDVTWPPVFKGQIKFYCEVRYVASARPKGKMGFKIS